jgi:hypothetical protein
MKTGQLTHENSNKSGSELSVPGYKVGEAGTPSQFHEFVDVRQRDFLHFDAGRYC